jgi:glycosyltransferase involved in cell wall biosynthesis
MESFSIIVCTYNPNFTIFKRLLDAILNFDNTSPDHEVVIVDNNSQPDLYSNSIIGEFLLKKAHAILIEEKKPGLTAARIAGIKQAKHDWVIFFDDDNEPAIDYLIQVEKLINQHKQVGAWGPGHLTVNYINSTETLFLKRIKWLFQERVYNGTFFDNNTVEGSEYYPFGTGMIIIREALIEYITHVEKGRYTMSDRNRKNLMSAGDVQILFTCLQMGYYAGSSNLLKLVHLIDSNKANHNYAVKLLYALNSSHLKSYQEVFCDKNQKINAISNIEVFKNIYSAIRLHKMHREKYTLTMFISKKLGELNSRIVAHGLPKPFFLYLFEILFFK